MFENINGDVEKTKISEVPFFQDKGDKMSFLFDYGADWLFEVEHRGFSVSTIKRSRVLKSVGESPVQYPEVD